MNYITRKLIVSILSIFSIVFVYINHKSYRYFYPFLKTESGILYKRMCMGNGKKPKVGEWLEMSLVIKSVSTPNQAIEKPSSKKPNTQSEDKEKEEPTLEVKNGTKKNDKNAKPIEKILLDTNTHPQPFFVEYGDKIEEKVMSEMIGMVEEGQKIIFKCSPAQYLGEEKKEDLDKFLKSLSIKAEDQFVVDIAIDKILTKEDYMKKMEKKREEYMKKMEEQRTQQAEIDKKIIAEHVSKHEIATHSTESGLCYVIDQSCQDGGAVVKGKVAKIHYVGKLLNGTVFDTSLESLAKEHKMYNEKRKYEPLSVEIGKKGIIAGLEEGLLLLKKGEKARFFIPSGLAYGPQEIANVLPANAVLIFEVEVVDLT